MCQFSHRQPPSLDYWYWLKTKIRCGLATNHPQLLKHLDAESQALTCYGYLCPWHAAESTFRLLLETALDRTLPWHWRNLCLDHAYRPLNQLERHAKHPAQRRRLCQLNRQLAVADLQPSLSYEREENLP